MTRRYSEGEEYLRKMSPEDRQARTRALWKHFVLYSCPNCGGLWFPRLGTWEEMPESYPCGKPHYGQMVKQRRPEFWEEAP